MVLGMLAKSVGTHFFTMASWHVFMQSTLQSWLVRRAGGFSVYREGMDRAAVNAAVEILENARRPLVMFPEGAISRGNDRLNSLMEGVAFIARTAARRRAKTAPPGQVVVHPVAMRYLFRGDLDAALSSVLDEIEARLSWRPRPPTSAVERIYRVGQALACLKEVEYLGHAQSGELTQRLADLIDHLLRPLEQQWVEGRSDGSVISRVKRLRTAMLPDMIDGDLSDEQRDQRWLQMADLNLAQQLSNYPPDYVRSRPTPERLLETVERFEEDLTDHVRVHRPMEVVIEVGPSIAVPASRSRKGTDSNSGDLMQTIEQQLTAMLGRLSEELTAVGT